METRKPTSGKTKRMDYGSVPDPARSYERARPEEESGMGRLDADECLPSDSRDRMDDAVENRQALRQLNADDIVNRSGGPLPDECRATSPARPKTRRDAAVQRRKDHSMRSRKKA